MKKDKDDPGIIWTIIGGFFILFIFLAIVGWAIEGFEFAKKKLDKRSSRKAYCAEKIYYIKNEYTAKKIYEACMDR